MGKTRLDIALVERGLAESRTKAQRLIEDGFATVNGCAIGKGSVVVSENDRLEIIGESCPYVSRGGLKLERALQAFSVNPSGMICGDFGASTGGFTDCLLQHGADKVYAVDVGTDQLAEKLRSNSRVVVMEKTNVRDLPPDAFSEALDLAVVDVSFISLRLILPIILRYMKQHGQIICLVKPQFEAGREAIGKRGVIRSPKTHCAVLREFFANSMALGLYIQNLTYSPIKGGEGNLEFLALLSEVSNLTPIDFERIVAQAHQQL